MNDSELTERAVSRALDNLADGGKPFACLIIRDGEVVIEAVNHVAQTGAPTAHAEIRAIRAAAQQSITDLGEYDVFITAYPCPMCLGARYYAQPGRVVFAATRQQEGEHYEDGNRLMTPRNVLRRVREPVEERTLRTEQRQASDPTAQFREWTARHVS